MKATILFSNTGPLRVASDLRSRDLMLFKRFTKRRFWRAHRKDAKALILSELNDDIDAVDNIFTSAREEDEQRMREWQFKDDMEDKVKNLRAKVREAYTRLYMLEIDLENAVSDLESL